jgi:manganese oxidase
LYPMDDPAKKAIKGYPQDMWMPMDDMFEKPETFGLRKGWSGAMMGMMTIVRVLPPELYDQIQERIKQAADRGRA